MSIEEFIIQMKATEINNGNCSELKQVYHCEIPDELGKIASMSKPVYFNGGRVLSVQEMIEASEEYDVDFIGSGIIPCIDIIDNDYVVYDSSKSIWTKFNIVDEVCFGEEFTNLVDLLNRTFA